MSRPCRRRVDFCVGSGFDRVNFQKTCCQRSTTLNAPVPASVSVLFSGARTQPKNPEETGPSQFVTCAALPNPAGDTELDTELDTTNAALELRSPCRPRVRVDTDFDTKPDKGLNTAHSEAP